MTTTQKNKGISIRTSMTVAFATAALSIGAVNADAQRTIHQQANNPVTIGQPSRPSQPMRPQMPQRPSFPQQGFRGNNFGGRVNGPYRPPEQRGFGNGFMQGNRNFGGRNEGGIGGYGGRSYGNSGYGGVGSYGSRGYGNNGYGGVGAYGGRGIGGYGNGYGGAGFGLRGGFGGYANPLWGGAGFGYGWNVGGLWLRAAAFGWGGPGYYWGLGWPCGYWCGNPYAYNQLSSTYSSSITTTVNQQPAASAPYSDPAPYYQQPVNYVPQQSYQPAQPVSGIVPPVANASVDKSDKKETRDLDKTISEILRAEHEKAQSFGMATWHPSQTTEVAVAAGLIGAGVGALAYSMLRKGKKNKKKEKARKAWIDAQIEKDKAARAQPAGARV